MTETANIRSTIDWTPFDQYPENTVECLCGHQYRSHAKFAYPSGHHPCIVARKPCAVCGGEQMRGSRSDPETMTL